MENNLIDREKKINKIKKLKTDKESIKIVKVLGKGVEGEVLLLKVNDMNLALKKSKIKFNVKTVTQKQSLKTDGLVEYYASKLVNLLIDDKINPHFVYNYDTHVSNRDDKIYSLNEFIPSKTLREFLKEKNLKKTPDKKLVFNIFFQILSALHSLKYQFNMIHADLHFENILIAKVPEGGYWKYTINGKHYYLPNMGYQIYLNDYGYAMIPDKLGKEWYTNYFKNIKDTNKYNLYDLLLVRFEFLEYLGPHFNTFFMKYFNYNDRKEYSKDPKLPYFPQDLEILDIIELLFSKNDISNCKDFEWYCYDEKSLVEKEKLIEEYNLDKHIEKDEIKNVLAGRSFFQLELKELMTRIIQYLSR